MGTGYYLQDNPNPNLGQFGWPRDRVSGVIGVHTTESGVVPAGPDGGAEDTARFIRGRTDYGSYHALADADSRLKLVHPSYAAWADVTNNAHAMSVSGAMNAARWRDLTPARAAAIVRNMGVAAAELVRDAMTAGLLDSPVPARRVTAGEAIAGTRPGFYGHGETNPGTRYDPGANFDWDLFLSTYAAAIGSAAIDPQGTISEEIFTVEQFDEIMRQHGVTHAKVNTLTQARLYDQRANQRWHGQTHAKVNALAEVVQQLAAGQGVRLDMAAVEAASKAGAAEALEEAGLSAEEIAAAIPEESLGALITALGDRLKGTGEAGK